MSLYRKPYPRIDVQVDQCEEDSPSWVIDLVRQNEAMRKELQRLSGLEDRLGSLEAWVRERMEVQQQWFQERLQLQDIYVKAKLELWKK